VLYSYAFGLGQVVYPTIPLEFYLAGSGTIQVNMQIYAANVIAYGDSTK
jgi:hypothetical protein